MLRYYVLNSKKLFLLFNTFGCNWVLIFMKITSIASSYFCENRIVGKTKTISNNLNNNISFKSTHYSLGQGEIEFDPIISKTYTGEKDSYAKSVNTTRVYLKDGATINNLKIRNTFCTYYTPNCPHVPNCICQPDIVLVDNATVNNYLDDKGSILFVKKPYLILMKNI